MTARGLIDHGHVMAHCFVVLHPAAIHENQLAGSNEALHELFYLGGLLLPPAREKGLRTRIAILSQKSCVYF